KCSLSPAARAGPGNARHRKARVTLRIRRPLCAAHAQEAARSCRRAQPEPMSAPHPQAVFGESLRRAHAALRAGQAVTAEAWLRALEAQAPGEVNCLWLRSEEHTSELQSLA